MTHDTQLLMSSLRQLSPPQALTLAQYLLKLLEKYSGEPHSSNPLHCTMCRSYMLRLQSSFSMPSKYTQMVVMHHVCSFLSMHCTVSST